MYKKITTVAFLIFCALSTFAQDAFLENLTLSNYIKANTDYPLKVQLTNLDAANTITGVTVTWNVDNGTTTALTTNIGQGGLPAGSYYVGLTLNGNLNISTAGTHTIKVWADATGEINRANDTITFVTTVLTDYAPKVTLVEEATGQWCPNCPRGGLVTDALSPRPDVAVVRYHNNDSMSFTQEDNYFDNYFVEHSLNGFYPALTVDMGEGGNYIVNTNSDGWASAVDAVSGISPAALTLTSSINTSTRVLTVTLTCNFKFAEDGNYSFNAFVLENGIIMHQYDNTKNPEYIAKYVHNNVLRAMLGGNGTQGKISQQPVANTDYTYTYTYTVPDDFILDNMSVVGTVFKSKGSHKSAINSAKSSTLSTGVNSVKANNNLKVYPNPFTSNVVLGLTDNSNEASVTLYSIDGREVFSKQYNGISDNLISVDLGNKNLVSGIYTIQVKTKDNIYTQKLVKY